MNCHCLGLPPRTSREHHRTQLVGILPPPLVSVVTCTSGVCSIVSRSLIGISHLMQSLDVSVLFPHFETLSCRKMRKNMEKSKLCICWVRSVALDFERYHFRKWVRIAQRQYALKLRNLDCQIDSKMEVSICARHY